MSESICHSSLLRKLAVPVGLLAALPLALAGCATHPAEPQASVSVSPAPGPEPSPAPSATPKDPPPPGVLPPAVVDTSADSQAVVQADLAFWQAYADGDAATACSLAVGLTPEGYLVALDGSLLDSCVAWLGAASTSGTSLTIGTPVIDEGIAMVTVSGVACGTESPTPDGCGTVPDQSSAMPASTQGTDFSDALGAVLGQWFDGAATWQPDVLVDVEDTWHPLLPVAGTSPEQPPADPVEPAPNAPGDDQQGQQDAPWTPQDWQETCPSGGCGGVPGLPPFVPGGGLSFGG